MLRSLYLAQRSYHPVARALSTAPGNAGSGQSLGPEGGGSAVPKPGGPTPTTTTTSQILQMWKSPPTSVSSGGGGGAAPLGGISSGGSGGIPGAASAARPGSTLVASLANIRKEMERNRRMQAERRTQAEALQNERRALQERAKELRRGGPSVHHYTQQNHQQQQQGASAQGAAVGFTPPSEQQQQQQQQRQQPPHQSRFSGGAGRSYRGSDGGGGGGSSAHSRLASGHGASTSSFSGLVVGEEGVVSASLERRRRRAAATAASNPKGAGGTGGPGGGGGSGSGAAGSGAAALRGLRLKRHQKVAFAEGQRTRAGRTITIREGMTIRELALGMRLKLMPLFQKLEAAGERQHRKASESVDADVAQLIAEELGMVVVRKEDPRRDRQRTPAPSPEALAASGAPFRAPIVAVLGHVDHGKTSLLDALRGATTASREAGGITQGIAAFSVAMRAKAMGTGNVRPPGGKVAKATTASSSLSGAGGGEEVGEEALAAATGMPGEAAPSATTAANIAGTSTTSTTRGRVRGKAAKAAAAAVEREAAASEASASASASATPPPPPPSNVDVITFIDTPGHALFSAMRRHGAAVTDIVVLCVDGSAGVQPQTRECIDIITSSASPCIVAVTKCDVVDPEEAVARVAAGLLEEGFATEAYGGDVPLIPLSSRTGMGLEDLKAAIALQAEALNLRAWVGKAVAAEVGGAGNTKAVAAGGLGKKGKKALPPSASSSSSSSSTTPSPPRVLPEAIVLDSRLIPGQGQVVDVVVTQGVLRVGDFVIAGSEMGRVKALFTDAVGAQSLNARLGGGGGGTTTTTTANATGGNKKNSSGSSSTAAPPTGEAFKLTPVLSVLPGTPVRVLGLRGVPPAGSDLLGVEDEPRGMAVLEGRARRAAAGEAMRVAAIDALVRRAEREEYARARDRKVAFSLAVSRERQRAALRKAGQPIPPRLAPAPWEGAILAEARAGGVVGVGASGRKERQQGGQQTSLALGFAAAAANADAAAAAAAGSGEGGAASTAPPILAVPTASLLLRADSAGALAALTAAVERIRGATVGVVSPRVVNASVGDVTEKDVAYAAEMGAHVVAYGGKIVPGGVGKLAEKKGVSLTQGEVIYRVLEGLCGVLGGYLPPVWEEEVTAVAEAKAVFPLNASSSSSKAPPSAAAGCVVVEGTFLKSAALFRVVRGGEVLHEVKELTSLQHFKKKVESVKKGDECGMSFEGFADIAVGDKIQTVVVKRKAQKLEVDWS